MSQQPPSGQYPQGQQPYYPPPGYYPPQPPPKKKSGLPWWGVVLAVLGGLFVLGTIATVITGGSKVTLTATSSPAVAIALPITTLVATTAPATTAP